MRTRATAYQEYDSVWSSILQDIRSRIADGETDPVAVVDAAMQAGGHAFLSSKVFVDAAKSLGIEAGRSSTIRVEEGRYVVADSDSAPFASLGGIIAERIAQSVPQVDRVVELGSGLGGNLFRIAARLSPAARERIAWFACELTKSGREATGVLAALAPELTVRVSEFDYYQHDLTFLPKTGHTLFFTAHSIEQIPELPPGLHPAMLDASEVCTIVHAEPVGWQLDPELVRWRHEYRKRGGVLATTRDFFRKVAFRLDRELYTRVGLNVLNALRAYDIQLGPADTGSSANVRRNAARWSARLDYNWNLVSTVRALEESGRLRITAIDAECMGLNPFNPTTTLVLEKTASQ